jgi:hypothetical protein
MHNLASAQAEGPSDIKSFKVVWKDGWHYLLKYTTFMHLQLYTTTTRGEGKRRKELYRTLYLLEDLGCSMSA